jgi:predicted type IV restriction endonuclease
MDEAETRRRLIDERLRLAGWDPNDPAQVSQELKHLITETVDEAFANARDALRALARSRAKLLCSAPLRLKTA